MDLPGWVLEAIRKWQAPETGEFTIRLDLYKTGVTRVRLGDSVTVKPPQK